jgi:hypothetical protein
MSFDINRLRRADRIVGVGAIAFFIFLFIFKWYGFSSNVPSITGLNVNISENGWHSFTNSRWIWLLTIIVALGSTAFVAAQRKLDLPVQPGVLVAALGALSTVLIFYRIVHHPTASANFGSFHASVGIKIGIWLGLIAAMVVTYGGYLKMQEEGISLGAVRKQAESALGGFTAHAGSSAAPVGGDASAPPAVDVPPATAAPPPAGTPGDGADAPIPG